MDPMLLAVQASGLALNMWQTSQASKMVGLGASLDRQQLDLRMQQETLLSTEQALQNSEQLRSVLSSQAAIMGARGQMPGVGSAQAIQQGALKEYGADERVRKMNLSFKKSQLEAQKLFTSLEAGGNKANLGYSLGEKSLEQLNFNTLFSGTNKLNQSMGTK